MTPHRSSSQPNSRFQSLTNPRRLSVFVESDVLFDFAFGPGLNSRPGKKLQRRSSFFSYGQTERSLASLLDDDTGGAEASIRRMHASVPGKLSLVGDVDLVNLRRLSDISTSQAEDEHDEGGKRETSDVSRRKKDDGAEVNPLSFTSSFGGGAALLFVGIVISSSLANLSLQRINSIRPGCGQLITLLQYIATTLEKSPKAIYYLRQPCIPFTYHLAFMVLMFLTTWMSSLSMESGIPFGHFLVVKNTNLVFSMLLGAFALGRRYTAVQVTGVVMVTAGVVICVLAENDGEASSDEDGASAKHSSSAILVGTLLCSCSTLSVSALGCLQERAFKVCHSTNSNTNPADEALFIMHLLGLPFFFIGSGFASISSHFSALFSPPSAPLWSSALLLTNIGATAILKRCFVGLLGMGGALTATMAVTVSRTLGIVISELMEEEDEGPGLMFWSGVVGVTLGSIAYVLGGKGRKDQLKKKEE